MRKKIVVALALTAGVGLLASVVLASHNEPAKAKGLKAELVTGYQACTAPNTATPGLGIPACSPPVPNDSVCKGFAGGKGAVKAKVITGDIKLQAKAKGLDPSCEGVTLCPVVSFRATTDNCTNGADCTAVDLNNFQVGFGATGCCVVTGGACKVKTTINSNLPGAIGSGNRLGIEIRGCGLQRSGAVGPALSCGLFVP